MLNRLPFSKKTAKTDASARNKQAGSTMLEASQAPATTNAAASSESESRQDSTTSKQTQRAGAVAAQGEPLGEFARRHGLSEGEVWRRLRSGELLGRSERGQLMILDETRTDLDHAALPPLPGEASLPAQALTLSSETQASSEVALLLDHLSLAKEENREILKMTQDAIRRVTELTDSIVAMKNAVIEAKDSQIDALREQVAARDERIQQLLQKHEDLEMLARALAERS